MTNRAFSLKSTSDKQKKLIVLLRVRTNDALNRRQLDTIISRLRPDKQYCVQVHTDPRTFGNALVLVRNDGRRDYGEVIFGQASFGISHIGSSENGQVLSVHDTAAAQIIRKVGSPAEQHALHTSETKRLCALFEIDTTKRFRELSTGNKKKVSILCALMPNPKVIVLDEPTSGLDPVMQKVLFEELGRRAALGSTVLLSSHNLAEVEEYCTRVAFIKDGTILAVTDLSQDVARSKVITVVGGSAAVPQGLAFLRQEGDKRVFRTELTGHAVLQALSVMAPDDFTVENESMEAYFWDLYGLEGAQ